MVLDWLTPEIAEEVSALRKKEYTYSRIVEHLQDTRPSLKLKNYSGLGAIICREADIMLQNLNANPFNED